MDFVKGMRTYSFNGLTLVGDKIAHVPEGGKQRAVNLEAHGFFNRFAKRLKVGMTVSEAYDLYESMKGECAFYVLWMSYYSYKPKQGEWWEANGQTLFWSRGMVRRYTAGGTLNPELRSTLDANDRTVFSEVREKMPLTTMRMAMLRSSKYNDYCRPIMSFTPPKQEAKESPVHGYRSLELPPLLSTGRVQVDVYYPNGAEQGAPDTIVVTLYAVTAIFKDKERRVVNEVAKQNIHQYFKFASRQMTTDQRVRELHIKGEYKPAHLSFTRDCCIVCEFKLA